MKVLRVAKGEETGVQSLYGEILHAATVRNRFGRNFEWT